MPWTRFGLPGRHEHPLRWCPFRVHRGLGNATTGARNPRLCFSAPATDMTTYTQSLPNDTADIRIVDRTAKGGLEGRQGEGTRIVLRCQPDGLGDERIIPN